MTSRYPPSLPLRRGPLSLYELRAFNLFLSRPKTLHSFAALGADAAMNYLDVRNALGVVVPHATRRRWIWGLADIGAYLKAAANPNALASVTEEEEARRFAQVASAIDRFDAYDAAKLRPLLPLPPADSHPFDPSRYQMERPAAGNVVALSTRRLRGTPNDEGGPQGGAPLGAA